MQLEPKTLDIPLTRRSSLWLVVLVVLVAVVACGAGLMVVVPGYGAAFIASALLGSPIVLAHVVLSRRDRPVRFHQVRRALGLVIFVVYAYFAGAHALPWLMDHLGV